MPCTSGWTLLRHDGADSKLGFSLGWFSNTGAGEPIIAATRREAREARRSIPVGEWSEYRVAKAVRTAGGITVDVPRHGPITFLD